MPNRHPGAVAGVRKDRQWDLDMPAYKRLRQNGVQPKRIADASTLEARATDQLEIELAQLVPKKILPRIKEGMAISKELDIAANQMQRKPAHDNA
jgi:hypothetical protein